MNKIRSVVFFSHFKFHPVYFKGIIKVAVLFNALIVCSCQSCAHLVNMPQMNICEINIANLYHSVG